MIAFRFNASSKVGFGHYVRCNAIATELKTLGYKTMAIVDEASELGEKITSSSFDVIKSVPVGSDVKDTVDLVASFDCNALLVDHYHCDEHYQMYLKNAGIAWGQFDFKCSGSYIGKFIININPAACPDWYQAASCSAELKYLCGPKYAVLKKKPPQNSEANKANTKKLFICLGGGDDQGLLHSLVAMAVGATAVEEIHVACGNKSSSISLIREQAYSNVHLHVDCDYMYTLMTDCQLAICSASTLSYELAYVGTPFICGYWAENQRKLADSWSEVADIHNLGDLTRLTKDALCKAIDLEFNNEKKRLHKANHLSSLVDGNGAERIAKELIAL